MALTKNNLINSVHNHLNIPKTRSAEPVEPILEIIKNTLKNGEDILISGFGKFRVREKNETRGRNPATRENLVLGARRVVRFRCSGILREMANKGQVYALD